MIVLIVVVLKRKMITLNYLMQDVHPRSYNSVKERRVSTETE